MVVAVIPSPSINDAINNALSMHLNIESKHCINRSVIRHLCTLEMIQFSIIFFLIKIF